MVISMLHGICGTASLQWPLTCRYDVKKLGLCTPTHDISMTDRKVPWRCIVNVVTGYDREECKRYVSSFRNKRSDRIIILVLALLTVRNVSRVKDYKLALPSSHIY